jgi:hypothetical protein
MEKSELFLKWFCKISGIKKSDCWWSFNKITRFYNLNYHYRFIGTYSTRLVMVRCNFEREVVINIADKEKCLKELGGLKIFWRANYGDGSFKSRVVPKDEMELEFDILTAGVNEK